MDCYEPDAAGLQRAHSMLTINAPRAIHELESLAAAQSTLAPLYLGWVYQHGNGVDEDLTQAEHWFKTALARGDATSSYYLGHLYRKTDRHREASDAFEQGANLGYLPSTYCLAMNFRDGKGRTPNADVAIQLFTSASEGGHIFARRALATYYLSGKFGLIKWMYGIWLFVNSVLKGIYLALRRSNDSRLMA